MGNPQELRDKTIAASADHVRSFFISGGSFYILHLESSGRNEESPEVIF